MIVPGTLAKAIEEFPPDSPMVDFLDTNLARATQYHYIQLLKRFFDSLRLNGTLDKQSREFLKKAERSWVGPKSIKVLYTYAEGTSKAGRDIPGHHMQFLQTCPAILRCSWHRTVMEENNEYNPYWEEVRKRQSTNRRRDKEANRVSRSKDQANCSHILLIRHSTRCVGLFEMEAYSAHAEG